MINNWDIVSRLDPTTKSLLYTLVIDGTEHDARLIAKKLQGYVQTPQPAEAPYVYAFELPKDLDEDTVEKIRVATREGVAHANKVNQFVAGGVLGEPLFNAEVSQEDKDFPSFVTLDPSESFFQVSDKPGNKQVSLELTEPALEIEAQSVKLDSAPTAPLPPKSPAEENTPLSQTESPATEEAEPITELPPIDEKDMLIKDMEDSVLSKMPQVEDIFAAETKYDMFMDAPQNSPLQAQQEKDSEIDNLADGKPNLEETFNVFEQKIKDQTSIIDLEELTAITDRLSIKDMEFIKHANTSPELAAEIAAHADEQEKTIRLNNPSASPENHAFSPADAILNTSLPEIPVIHAAKKPALPPEEGDTMENNTNPELPEEANLTDNSLPTAEQANKPDSATQPNDLPEITVREQSANTLDKTFHLTTTLNADVLRSQYQKSFHNPQDPKPPHHVKPEPPLTDATPTIRLKRRQLPAVPPAPQEPAPSLENTTLRLRRKAAPQPPAADTPAPPAPKAPAAPTPKPENTQMAPASKTVFEKTTTIDHSIELPLSELKKHNWPLEVPLMPTYTLENMVMSVNRFAHATAISVMDNPGKLYNPLVLHGPTGTGKTHFLNAIKLVEEDKNMNPVCK